MASFKIKGDKALIRRLKQIQKEAPEAVEAGLYQEGLRAQEIGVPLTPLDIGTLRNSWYVAHPTRTRKGSQVEIGVGGAAEDYAMVQHERLDFKHEVGGPKFVERALIAIQPQFLRNLLAAARAYLGKK